MNGIERNFGVFYKHTKQLKLTFTFISLAILLAISSVALVVNAQEPDTNTDDAVAVASTTNGQSEAAQERVAEMKENRTETQAEKRVVLSTRLQERLTNLAANVSNRMEAAIERLTKIAVRLQSRINKLEDEGVDTTDAQSYLDDASRMLTDAADTINDIDARIAEVTGSETPRVAWETAKAIYLTVKTDILGAHQALREAVATLKTAITEHNEGPGVSDAVRQNELQASSTTDVVE